MYVIILFIECANILLLSEIDLRPCPPKWNHSIAYTTHCRNITVSEKREVKCRPNFNVLNHSKIYLNFTLAGCIEKVTLHMIFQASSNKSASARMTARFSRICMRTRVVFRPIVSEVDFGGSNRIVFKRNQGVLWVRNCIPFSQKQTGSKI